MTKTLILLRHAHRDTTDKEADNGLSAKGVEQAEVIGRFFSEHRSSAQPLLLSSPKRRCRETLEPISRISGTKIEIEPALEEQNHKESDRKFAERIERFLNWWKALGPDLTILCSHGDWLPIALELLIHERIEMQKGAWVELSFKLSHGRQVLIQIEKQIQKL